MTSLLISKRTENDRKGVPLSRRIKGRLGTTPYPPTSGPQRKSRDMPIGLKDTSGLKDNEETT